MEKLKRIDLWDAGMFPLLTGRYWKDEGHAMVPLEVVLPHEAQAQRNHDQTLHRLAERGGLSASELAAVLEDRQWRPMATHLAWAAIFKAIKAFQLQDLRAAVEAQKQCGECGPASWQRCPSCLQVMDEAVTALLSRKY